MDSRNHQHKMWGFWGCEVCWWGTEREDVVFWGLAHFLVPILHHLSLDCNKHKKLSMVMRNTRASDACMDITVA